MVLSTHTVVLQPPAIPTPGTPVPYFGSTHAYGHSRLWAHNDTHVHINKNKLLRTFKLQEQMTVTSTRNAALVCWAEDRQTTEAIGLNVLVSSQGK